jgi:hypothetical protein
MNWRVVRDEGVHLLNAEAALYRGGMAHLLLPFQRDRFASDLFMVPDMLEARYCLMRAGFREGPQPEAVLVDAQTGLAIRLIEGIQPKR